MAKELPILAILGGTGKEGPGLAMRWAYAGYQVIIGSRLKQKAQQTATVLNEELNLDTVTGLENDQAARMAAICIFTVEQSAHQAALVGLKDALHGKILVDATARVDFRDPTPPTAPAAAEIAQKILGDSVRVVAAFQNVPAHALRRNLGEMLATQVIVCSDDELAAEEVIDLAQGGGMKAYYGGTLTNAIVVEGLVSVLISINKYYGIKTASIAVTGL
jgi:NADPH-dependent F420 reductase